MSEGTSSNTLGKHLSAEELLKNRGISIKAWKEYEESSRALPKIGEKQFEPNGSWLQNKQIEKGLESRKHLLGIERVERRSQLASAEWLPDQKRARVTKKSGQQWTNYGLEVNANLYLIPEEALMLLETECLELTWDGIPMSIQQAYEVLIDSKGSDCSLDEYRVYSQLTRLGYRLQRFCYDKTQLERMSRSEESQQRKKVIIDPEKGLWMKQNLETDPEIKEIVLDTVEDVNDSEATKRGKTEDGTSEERNSERKNKNGRLEIVSEQSVIPPIKIVKDGTSSEHQVSKWPGARIQRNVKLLPKRNDIIAASPEVSHITPSRRRRGSLNAELPDSKKPRREVIDLSDDEVEQISRPMTRMEMLNCLPNIANQIFITTNIPRRYVPRGVRPQRSYRYDSRKLRKAENSNRPREASESSRKETRNGSQRNSSEDPSFQRALVPVSSYSSPVRSNYYNYHRNANQSSMYSHRHNQYSSSSMMMQTPGGICMQQISIGPGVWQNSQSVISGNRWTSFHMNMFRNAAVMDYAMRSVFMHSAYQPNFNSFMPYSLQQQFSRPQRYLERPIHHTYNPRHRHSSPARSIAPSQTSSDDTVENVPAVEDSRVDFKSDTYQSTFVKLPGASTWPNLKQKWRDAKTITIDDEDSGNYDGDDSNDIQTIDQMVKPLVNPKIMQSISEIYERLRIIKSAPERTVRRKRSDYKICYNVYSGGQNFRKSNPGMPMFHLIIVSHKGNEFLQPVELNRLQQDGKGAPIMFAHVSNSSITYLQSGIVSIPNLVC